MVDNDDHYIAGPNAHLDLRAAMAELREQYHEQEWGEMGLRRKGGQQKDFRRQQELEFYYHYALRLCSQRPTEPSPDALVCRFLTPEKFLWFLHQRSIFFCTPDRFDDLRDCLLPSDYRNDIALVVQDISKTVTADQWLNHCHERRRDWLISCWTEIERAHDNKLIWYKYAGGPTGVGITIRYSELSHWIRKSLDQCDRDGSVKCGRVNYASTAFNQLPFNKRPGFESENEVRFALRHAQFLSTDHACVSDIFDQFGLRFSEDVDPDNRQAILAAWERADGNMDRVQHG